MKRSRTPATLVAALALVAALTGTALAGSGPDATGSASLKKTATKALKLAKKNKGSIKSISLTPGPQGIAGEQGEKGEQGEAAAKLFAVLTDKGALVSHAGVSTAKRNGGGDYEVRFNQSVKNCAATGNPALAGGTVLKEGTVAVEVAKSESNLVRVSTFDKNGTAADSDFNIAVIC